jgi:site-specific DNA recombinase
MKLLFAGYTWATSKLKKKFKGVFVMIVFGYPRVSTDEQVDKGNSLNEQMERMTAYCKVMDWPEPIFFVEEGYSAKSINRPELTKLLQKVKDTPGPGVVLTTKLDRLSRKLLDILSLNEYFERYDFNFVSATEGFDTSTPAGRLVLQMLGMVAEFERERNSERVRDNMTSLAKNSSKAITRPCYGYDVVDGQMVINIEESLVLKQGAYDLLAGVPSRTIYGKWNVDGIKTKEGNEWNDKTFRELYKRETLIGMFIYNKTYRKGNKVLYRDPSEWIINENHHDPILEIETFEKLKELFEGRKSVGRHMSDETYLLSGLVSCGHCKSKMNGRVEKNFSKKLNQTNVRYKYLCDGYLKKNICFHHFVNRDEIEEIIISRINTLSKSAPGELEIVFAEIKKPKDNDKKELMKKLDKLDKKIQKLIDAYNEDLITAHDLKVATDRTKKERELIMQSLETIDGNSIVEQEKALIDKSMKLANDVNSFDRITAKQAIRQLVASIKITNREVTVAWRAE